MTIPGGYKHHCFLPQIITPLEWFCDRFPLSLHMVEEMLLRQGTVVSRMTPGMWTTWRSALPISRSFAAFVVTLSALSIHRHRISGLARWNAVTAEREENDT
jgi:hypothetical protein